MHWATIVQLYTVIPNLKQFYLSKMRPITMQIAGKYNVHQLMAGLFEKFGHTAKSKDFSRVDRDNVDG